MRVKRGSAGGAIVTVAAVIGAVGISACGSSGGSNVGGGGGGGRVSGDPVAMAASVSNSAAGYKMDFNMALTSSALPATINATGNGSYDASNHTGVVNLAMNFGSIPQVASVLGSSTLRMQEILDGTTIYIKLPAALIGKLPGGASKPWFSVNLSQLGSASGALGLGSLRSNPTSTNPGAMLQYLRTVSGGITKVGTATVNGYQTTEYRATLDLAKAPSMVPPAMRTQTQQAIASLEKLVSIKSFPIMVWVDSNHLVRRLEFAFNESLASTGQTIKIQMTMNITGYGPQPAPPIPPASEVTNLTSLLGSALSSSTGG